MNIHIPYSSIYCKKKPAFILKLIVGVIILLFIFQISYAQKEPEYYEIPFYINVRGLGTIEIPAAVRNKALYLSVADLFDFLKIKNTITPGIDSLSGFLISPQSTFLFDKNRQHVLFQKAVYSLTSKEAIYTETTLYLRSDYFSKIFGLDCAVNLRSLTVVLTTQLELPAITEMKREAMRNNIDRLKGEIKVDTIIPCDYPLFRLGMADWSVISSSSTITPNDTRLNLTAGTFVAGGETDFSLNYQLNSTFSEKEQYYQWHFVNNDLHALKQVMAGKIYTPSISSIFNPVVGVQFANTPTTYRRSFGTYTLSNHTQPGWMVELYVNNVLVDYMKADAAGFYTFEVPLVYGNSAVKLRFYGLYGEDQTTEQNIEIPFNFLPYQQFEYNVSTGIVEDSLSSKFSRASFNYGLNKRITIGGGMEYLSSVVSGVNMPFFNTSVRFNHNILFYGEYVAGVRSKALLNYHLPSNLQFEFSYILYQKEQKAINTTFLEERKMIITYPLHISKFSSFSRLTIYQVVVPSLKSETSKYTTVEALITAMMFGASANLTTYTLLIPPAKPYLYGNLSVNIRLPGKVFFSPQAQYAYTGGSLMSFKGEFGKALNSRGYINLFYEKNYTNHIENIGLGFRYNFSMAQLGSSVSHNNQSSTMVQSARGSLIYDSKTNYLNFNNRVNVGRAGIIIIPYLDLNGNGIMDKGETKVQGLKINLPGGHIFYNKDTSIRITDLEANTKYNFSINTDGLDNTSWQIRNKSIRITLAPNQFKLIEVPVTVMGEVSGMVYFKEDGNKKGLGRIKINFYRKNSSLFGQILSESDGSFNCPGFPPGTYTARIDSTQLHNLKMESIPGTLHFNIVTNKDGDVINGLEFTLTSSTGDIHQKINEILLR